MLTNKGTNRCVSAGTYRKVTLPSSWGNGRIMMLVWMCVRVCIGAFSLRAWRHYSCGESEWQCWSLWHLLFFFVDTLPLKLIIHLQYSKGQDSCQLFCTIFISPHNLSPSISSSLLPTALLSAIHWSIKPSSLLHASWFPVQITLTETITPPPRLLLKLWPQEAFFTITCRLAVSFFHSIGHQAAFQCIC